MILKVHHFAISVKNIEATLEFYAHFGFELAVLWEAQDKALRIAHMTSDSGIVLEAFEYSDNASAPRPELAIGNDLTTLGVKHIGFHVADLAGVRDRLLEAKLEVTPVQHGRTLIDYFFVRDPDGNWVELVHENRSLTKNHPLIIQERPAE